LTIEGTATLTLAAGFTVRGGRGTIGSRLQTAGANALINQGTILANVAGTQIAINAMSLENRGSLNARNGGRLQINLALSNSGALSSSARSVIAIAGSLTMLDASSFTTELASTNASQIGRLEVTGSLDFGGTLNIGLASGFSPSVNDSFQVVTYGSRLDQFAAINGNGITYTADYAANSLNLTVVAAATASIGTMPGDFNGDDRVDTADYVVYRKSLGQRLSPFTLADGNGSGIVDSGDYDVWKANFGKATSAPEAASSKMLAAAVADEFESDSAEPLDSSAAFDLALTDLAKTSRALGFVPAKRPFLKQSVASQLPGADSGWVLLSTLTSALATERRRFDVLPVDEHDRSVDREVDEAFAQFADQPLAGDLQIAI
jgi:hypothetical protein